METRAQRQQEEILSSQKPNGDINFSRSRILLLPAELIHRIFNHAEKRDVPSARLACHLFADIGIEHLIEEVHLIYKRDRFERLSKIASVPGICKNIRSLHFQCDRLRTYLNVAEWLNSSHVAHDFRFKHLHTLHSSLAQWHDYVGDSELMHAWQEHNRLVREQKKINPDGVDIKHLTQLFKACPKLEDVTLVSGKGPRPRREADQLAFETAKTASFQDVSPVGTGFGHLDALCRALSIAGKSLIRFTACNVSYIFFRQNEIRLINMQTAFANLQSFRMSVHPVNVQGPNEDGPGHHISDIRDAMSQGFLRKLLLAMPDLRVLKLDLPRTNGDYWEFCTTFQEVFEDCRWPKLLEFRLTNVCTTEDDLVGFLLLHASKLRRLFLGNIHFTAGGWVSCFQRLSRRFPALQRLELCRYFGLDDGLPRTDPDVDLGIPYSEFDYSGMQLRRALVDYIRNGGPFPSLSDRDQMDGLGFQFDTPAVVEDEGEYDSDGAYVVYTRDEMDLA